MRLRSTVWFMIFLPPAVAAYGWVCEEHVNVAAICVMLFLTGFFSVYVRPMCTRRDELSFPQMHLF